MAEIDSPEMNCVYVETSLDTNLAVLVHNHVTISDFKEKLRKDHRKCFPKTGEIDISAVKVKRVNPLGLVIDYHLPDCMRLSKAFVGVSNDSWFVFVDADAVRVVGNRELVDVDGDENRLNHELVVATGSLLLDGYTKNPEQEFENGVVEKKRKLKSSDGEKRRKKRSVDPHQFDADATASRFDVGESHELRGNVQVEVVAAETLTEATGKEMEMGRDGIETDKLVSRTENHLETNSGLTTRTDTEKKIKRKKRSKDGIEQSSAAAITDSRDIVNENEVDGVSATVDPVDVTLVSLPVARGEDLDNPVAEASQREIEMGEKSIEDVGTDNIETGILVSPAEDLLDTNSGLTTRADTEKKERRKKRSKDDTEQPSVKRKKRSKDDTELSSVKRKKRSKDDISQSSAAAITTSRDIVNENESNGVPENVDPVDATPVSLPVARGENLDNAVAEASQKEIEMGEKSVEDVERDSIKTDNLVSHTEDLLDTNSGLTTRADTEKKERRKKRSKDDIEQSAARRKKSSKGDINQSFAATTASGDIVNEINGVPAHDLPADATPESVPIVVEARQKEAETGEKIDDAVGGAKAITSAADTIQPSIEIDAGEAKSVKLAKMIKSKKTKIPAKEEILVASGAQNIEPLEVVDGEGTAAKKIKSKETKTPAKKDTLVASGAQNVEPVEVVDGEGTDKVIRNVLDSLQENNETEEDLEKTGKKSSKKLKKHSLKVAESLVSSVEVNNAPLEETPPIDIRNDTDAFFTPAMKDTESDASVLKKISEVSDNADLHPSSSIDGSFSSMKPKAKKSRVQQPSSSGTSLLQSVVKNDRSRSMKAAVNSKKQDEKQDVKTSAKPVTVEKRKTNFFEGAEIYSSEDEHNKTSDVSTKTPSDYSSDDDSDVTSMSRKQGNNLDGGTNKLLGSFQDILRRSSSYKKALIRAQSQPDILDDVDWVPDSQAA